MKWRERKICLVEKCLTLFSKWYTSFWEAARIHLNKSSIRAAHKRKELLLHLFSTGIGSHTGKQGKFVPLGTLRQLSTFSLPSPCGGSLKPSHVDMSTSGWESGKKISQGCMKRSWTHSSCQMWTGLIIQQFELMMLPVFQKHRAGTELVPLHGIRVLKDIPSKTQNCGSAVFQKHMILFWTKPMLFHGNLHHFHLDHCIAHNFTDTSFPYYSFLWEIPCQRQSCWPPVNVINCTGSKWQMLCLKSNRSLAWEHLLQAANTLVSSSCEYKRNKKYPTDL